MEEEIVALNTKSNMWMKHFLASIFIIHPWTIDNNFSLLQTLGSLLLVIFMGWCLIFLASMVMTCIDGFTGKNNSWFCIALLMSINSHLHHFIWNMKLFNGSISTSRLMTRKTIQIFPTPFATFWPKWFWWIHRRTHQTSPN